MVNTGKNSYIESKKDRGNYVVCGFNPVEQHFTVVTLDHFPQEIKKANESTI